MPVTAQELTQQLLAWTVANSGHEAGRDYLGMSQIYRCPLDLYTELLTPGRKWATEDHLRFYAGYLFGRDVKARLAAIGHLRPGSERELVARFDTRFRGHTDGEVGDDLLEIKSTNQHKLDEIIAGRRIPDAHFNQVQVYMAHGGYTAAMVVYVARDTNSIHVVRVTASLRVQERLNMKAKVILTHLDRQTPPRCKCGRCNG
ncbi:MAG: hypothetical protein L0332_34545 [Chloroflexi bacterium]|nr:hypothetical protein [Chloroflexota bacterium]